jgi:hypothetical protein
MNTNKYLLKLNFAKETYLNELLNQILTEGKLAEFEDSSFDLDEEKNRIKEIVNLESLLIEQNNKTIKKEFLSNLYSQVFSKLDFDSVKFSQMLTDYEVTYTHKINNIIF